VCAGRPSPTRGFDRPCAAAACVGHAPSPARATRGLLRASPSHESSRMPPLDDPPALPPRQICPRSRCVHAISNAAVPDGAIHDRQPGVTGRSSRPCGRCAPGPRDGGAAVGRYQWRQGPYHRTGRAPHKRSGGESSTAAAAPKGGGDCRRPPRTGRRCSHRRLQATRQREQHGVAAARFIRNDWTRWIHVRPTAREAARGKRAAMRSEASGRRTDARTSPPGCAGRRPGDPLQIACGCVQALVQHPMAVALP
jgi:hypothetical protein